MKLFPKKKFSRLKNFQAKGREKKGECGPYWFGDPDNNVSPNVNLVAGVIKRAVDDYLYPLPGRDFRPIQEDAKIFIDGSGLNSYCDLVGINSDFIRRKVAAIKKMGIKEGLKKVS